MNLDNCCCRVRSGIDHLQRELAKPRVDDKAKAYIQNKTYEQERTEHSVLHNLPKAKWRGGNEHV